MSRARDAGGTVHGGVATPAAARRRFLLTRCGVGLIAGILVGLQSSWGGRSWPLHTLLSLCAWLLASSGLVLVRRSTTHWTSIALGLALFGDCIAAAALVRATGSLHSPALLLLALPILAGGLVLFWRVGLLLGLVTSLLYGLMALEQARHGVFPGAPWVLLVFHTLFFSAMGLAGGLLARRMASSMREVAETRSELETVRLSTDRIVASLSCGLVAVEPSGDARALNPEARRLLGLPAQEEVIPPDVAARNGVFFEMLRDGLRDAAGGRDAELTLWNAQGESFPAWVKVAPVVDSRGRTRGLVGLFWDLTERKQLETLARERERLATVGELSAGLAHEIRNSLKPITGSIELLTAKGGLPPDARPVMDLISREADSLEAFLSQFLALARDKTLKLEDVDIDTLLRQEFSALAVSRAWGEVRSQVSAAEGVRLIGDREWLRQIFRNVILNAFEAAPQGLVRAQLETFERGGQPWVRVRVIDDGPGLRDLAADDAFRPFRTTKPAGTGLGLPIAQRGVRQHGGQIAFDMEWDTGGCIVIELPAVPSQTSGEAGSLAEEHEAIVA